MSEDRTRQVDRPGTDEVFEVGDSSIIERSGSSMPPPKQGGSLIPWLIVALVLGAGGVGYYLFVMPLQDAYSEQNQRLQDTEKTLAETKTKLSLAEVDLNNLRDKSNSQAKTLEEQAQQLKELTSTKDELESKLKDEIAHGDVLVKQVAGELVVDLQDQVLFPSGASEMNDKGKEVLQRVGETMFKAGGKVIQVVGHTDNQPISDKLKTQYPSNWELATSRALNVVHFLEDTVKVPGERLVVTGFGQYRPIAKNASKEGRKKNRRIEVILLPLKK